MEKREWIVVWIAIWGAGLSSILALREWWRSRRRVEVIPYTYDYASNVGLSEYAGETGLPNLAVRVINHSEYPVDAKSVGLCIRKGHFSARKLTSLECPDIRKTKPGNEEPKLLFKFAKQCTPEPEREYKPVRVEPHNYFIFIVDPQENGRTEDLSQARRVFVRLADDSVYVSPGAWKTLFSRRAREANALFLSYCSTAVEKAKKAKKSIHEWKVSQDESCDNPDVNEQ